MLKCIRLEAGWIMTNLAYGNEEELQSLLGYTLDNGMNLLQFIKRVFSNHQHDLVLVDQIMFLLGNVTGTSENLRIAIK